MIKHTQSNLHEALQIRDVAPWPLDGGASLISGEHSIVKQLIEDNSLGIPHRASWITNFVLRNDTNELLPLKEGVPEGERLDRLHSKVRSLVSNS